MTCRLPGFLMDKSSQIVRDAIKEPSGKDDDGHVRLWRRDKSAEGSNQFIEMVYGRPIAFKEVVRPQLSIDSQADDAGVEELFSKYCALYYTKAEQITSAQLETARNDCFSGWFDHRPRPGFGPQLLGEIDTTSLHDPRHLQWPSCRKTGSALFCEAAQTHRMVCRVLDQFGCEAKESGKDTTILPAFRNHFMLVDLENITNDGFTLVKINTRGVADQDWVYSKEDGLSFCQGSSWKVMAALIQEIGPVL